MATIGSATLKIVPKFDGLQKAIEENVRKAVGKSTTGTEPAWSKSGEEGGRAFARGMGKSSAMFAAATAVTTKAIDTIGSHVGDAAARFDTLNNYPKVMESLGFSADDADRSIERMNGRLSVLPTRLDDMAGTVKGLSVITKDLDKATDAGLALNDMLLASGSSTQLTTAAMEQFRQMLSKGKPEMEDWKSLTSAMPGQMDQLAKSMLGPTAGANDLYAALGGGKNQATISMEQLLDEIIRLDKQGGAGFESFEKQALTATGGVQTSMANVSNAVTKGITSIMDTVGKENISSALNGIKSGINGAFSALNKALGSAMPQLTTLAKTAGKIAPQVLTATVAFKGLQLAGGGVSKVAGFVRQLSKEGMTLKTVNAALGTSLTPVNIGLTAAAAAAGLLISVIAENCKKSREFEKATKGLSDAVGDTTSLRGFADTLESVGDKAVPAAMGIDELMRSIGKHVDAINENNKAAEMQIATLNSVQQVIGESAGKTDLSADAQGRLNWALKQLNEQYGLNITSQDVMNGQYRDAEGNIKDVVDAVNDLCESKKQEARAAALTQNLTEAYSAQSDAAKTLAAAQKDYNDKVDYYMRNIKGCTEEQAKHKAMEADVGKELVKARDAYNGTADSVSKLEGELGLATEATSEGADALTRWAGSTSELFRASLEQNGTSISAMCDDLRTLGVDTTQLGSLTSEQLDSLAWGYDGTMASIAEDLRNAGVGMSNLSATTSEKSSDMLTSIWGLGDGVASSMIGMGYDLGALSNKLSDAGVTTGRLKAIGGENFQSLAASCGGNVDLMVQKIQEFNDKPMNDKDADVDVDSKSVGKANERIDEFRKQPDDLGTKTGHVNIFEQIWKTITGDHASGGIRPHADGGIRPHADGGISVRAHAGGAIATKAVPLDIVGEDGAEAIIPLTNKRYSKPFADILAQQINEGRRDESRQVTQTINIYQPVKSPDELARTLRMQARYGIAASY